MQAARGLRLPGPQAAAARHGERHAAANLGDVPVPRSENHTQITRALLRLRELILNGEFAHGARMSELPLVERLGVSRTPLRLALAQLEHEGLLRGLAGGGYVVREFTRADISDAIELRGVLEGTGARFAAERGVRRSELRALREVNDAISGLVHRNDYASFEGFLELNARFHAQLLKLARSPLLERALESAVSLPFAGPGALVLAQAELAESRDILIIAHRHHTALIESIEQRQGARAENVAREHARLSLTNLDIVLGQRDVLDRLPGASLLSLPPEPRAVLEPEPGPV
jgi:GntR family transcriptional regulator, vanillate catabolism transcriptional regulator